MPCPIKNEDISGRIVSMQDVGSVDLDKVGAEFDVAMWDIMPELRLAARLKWPGRSVNVAALQPQMVIFS
jgi:hypothetical protein